MLFYHQGGVDVGDVDAKASFCDIPVGEMPEKGTGNHNYSTFWMSRILLLNIWYFTITITLVGLVSM